MRDIWFELVRLFFFFFLFIMSSSDNKNKKREEEKRKEGFKSIFKRSLHLLAVPYSINLIRDCTYISPGACVWCF